MAVTSCHGWLDSNVALFWIQDVSQYKQFVVNRVRKIREKKGISWRYVPTDKNPSHQGSRGVDAEKLKGLWLKGPEWLRNPSEWPENIALTLFIPGFFGWCSTGRGVFHLHPVIPLSL